MKQSEFVVRRFVSRNGTASWRVAGRVRVERDREREAGPVAGCVEQWG